MLMNSAGKEFGKNTAYSASTGKTWELAKSFLPCLVPHLAWACIRIVCYLPWWPAWLLQSGGTSKQRAQDITGWGSCHLLWPSLCHTEPSIPSEVPTAFSLASALFFKVTISFPLSLLHPYPWALWLGVRSLKPYSVSCNRSSCPLWLEVSSSQTHQNGVSCKACSS